MAIMRAPRRATRRTAGVLAVLALVATVAAFGCRSAEQEGEAGTASAAPAWGVPVFPGAEARPEVAAAVHAYYASGLAADGFAVAVYETDASFDEVHDFYGPRMEGGKWGWRRKELPLEHQTRTLAFLRQRLVAERGEDGRLPAVFAPLLGDPDLGDEEMAARLAALAARHPDVHIEIVEGVRPIAGDPRHTDVRVVVERPYLDLTGLRLVDRTRIQILRLPGS